MEKFRIYSEEDFNSGFTIEAEDFEVANRKVLDLIDIHKVREFDYCTNCEKEVEQKEIEEGVFGCGECKRSDCIEIRTEIID